MLITSLGQWKPMNKLDIVKFLIEEIEKEQKLIELHLADTKQAWDLVDNIGGYAWQYKKWTGRLPSQTRIKSNCKKIRQLMLDISKEEL